MARVETAEGDMSDPLFSITFCGLWVDKSLQIALMQQGEVFGQKL